MFADQVLIEDTAKGVDREAERLKEEGFLAARRSERMPIRDLRKGSTDQRTEPRMPTFFFAVEVLGADLYYRFIRNISTNGFSFEDPFPLKRADDPIVMEFPLPGSVAPIRITGRIVYARADHSVGVRIEDVERERFARLMINPPRKALPR